jgi:N-acyl-phosphatidylethanolamine-hydrolysing phospholipase D
MDTATLQSLAKRPRPPHIFAPLGNDAYFESIGVKEGYFHCLDWWESCDVNVVFTPAPSEEQKVDKEDKPPTALASVKITCTPCQHASNRSIFDMNHTLWASWAIEDTTLSSSGRHQAKVWFGGDTAYKTVHKGDDVEELPVCPAFKEIGEKFGGFDLALIPIGYAFVNPLSIPYSHCMSAPTTQSPRSPAYTPIPKAR